ncbi:MAG: hypothetical protein V3T88_01535 [Nitrosomonadaceae bacterium]
MAQTKTIDLADVLEAGIHVRWVIETTNDDGSKTSTFHRQVMQEPTQEVTEFLSEK